MRVENALRESLRPPQQFKTPGKGKPFVLDRIDSAGIVLLLGEKAAHTRISWDCLEGVVPYLRARGGQVPIGGRHDVVGNPNTLDGHLKGWTKRTTAGWVAVVLEQAGVVVIDREWPQTVRLTPAFS